MEAVLCSETKNRGLNRETAAFVARAIWGSGGEFEKYCSVAIIESGHIIAGVVFHNWHPEEGVIELSIGATSPRWMTRANIASIMAVPFDIMRCQMVATRMAADNAAALKVNRWMGFRQFTIPRMRGRNADEVIGTLTDDDWRAHPVYIGAAKL